MSINQHNSMLLACLLLLTTAFGSEPLKSNHDGAGLQETTIATTHLALPTQGVTGGSTGGQVGEGLTDSILGKNQKRSSISENVLPGQDNDSQGGVKKTPGKVTFSLTPKRFKKTGGKSKGQGKGGEPVVGGSHIEVQLVQLGTTSTGEGTTSGGDVVVTIKGGSSSGGAATSLDDSTARKEGDGSSDYTTMAEREEEEFEEVSWCCCFKKKVRKPKSTTPDGLSAEQFKTQGGTSNFPVASTKPPLMAVTDLVRPISPRPQRVNPGGKGGNKSHQGGASPDGSSTRQATSLRVADFMLLKPTANSRTNQSSTGSMNASSSSASISSSTIVRERDVQDISDPLTTMSLQVPLPNSQGGAYSTPTNSPPMTRTYLGDFSKSNTPDSSPETSGASRSIQTEDIPRVSSITRYISAPDPDTSVPSGPSSSSSSTSAGANTLTLLKSEVQAGNV